MNKMQQNQDLEIDGEIDDGLGIIFVAVPVTYPPARMK